MTVNRQNVYLSDLYVSNPQQRFEISITKSNSSADSPLKNYHFHSIVIISSPGRNFR